MTDAANQPQMQSRDPFDYIRPFDYQVRGLQTKLATAKDQMGEALRKAHLMVGDRNLGSVGWQLTNEETMIRLDRMASLARSVDGTAPTLLTHIQGLHQTITHCELVLEHLDAIYIAGPWSRFYRVPGGRIHAGNECRGIRGANLELLAHLSGRDPGFAVGAHGPVLCTICFPDVPVELTVGKHHYWCTLGVDPDVPEWLVGKTRTAQCACGHRGPLAPSGGLRKHRPLVA